jgi:hypothetical protein
MPRRRLRAPARSATHTLEPRAGETRPGARAPARDHGEPPKPPKPAKTELLLVELLSSKAAGVVMACLLGASRPRRAGPAGRQRVITLCQSREGSPR